MTKIILSGYTPYPDLSINHEAPRCAWIDGEITRTDPRLPHIREKMTDQIHKTALGAEALVPFEYTQTPNLSRFKEEGYRLVALEQDARAHILPNYVSPQKIALLIGEEVHGITKDLLDECDECMEIPMYGQKESFNVSVATGIALYALTI